MLDDLLPEFCERILGAAVFIAGVTLVILQFNQVSSFTAQVKEEYANDAVYSEASFKVTDESSISRDELIAMLMSCPHGNLTVKDEVSGYIIEVKSGFGVDNVLKVQHANIFNASATMINMGKDRWDLNQLKLNEWLQASSYRVSDVTDSDGNVISVMYWGV